MPRLQYRRPYHSQANSRITFEPAFPRGGDQILEGVKALRAQKGEILVKQRPEPHRRGVKLRQVFLMDDSIGKYFKILYKQKEYWVPRQAVQATDFENHWMRIDEAAAHELGIVPWMFPDHWFFGPFVEGIWAEEYEHYEEVLVKVAWVRVVHAYMDDLRASCWTVEVSTGRWRRIPRQAVLRVLDVAEGVVMVVTAWAVQRYQFAAERVAAVREHHLKAQYRKRG